jgi:uncharacterized membrane protein
MASNSDGQSPPPDKNPHRRDSQERPSSDPLEPLEEIVKDPRVVKILVGLARFTGSLPYPPDFILEGWERIYPGITQKLIEQTERQTAHRHRLEEMRAVGAEKRANRGQLIMAAIAVIGLSLSAYVGVNGNWIVGSVLAIVSIGGPTAATAIAHGWWRDSARHDKN